MQTDLSDEMLGYAKGTFANFAASPWRENQMETVRWVLEQERKVTVLHGPCGVGKSLIGMAIAAMYDGATYLCSSKALQDQLVLDYPEAKALKGRNNYVCQLNTMLSAAECVHSKRIPCRFKHECDYEVQKKTVLSSRYKILNYTYWLYECNFVGMFSGLEYLICDEGDTLESHLSKFISLNIPIQTIKNYKAGYPKRKTAESKSGVSSWREWGNEFKKKVGSSMGKLEAETGEWSSISSEWQVDKIKQLQRARNLYGKLNMFTEYVNEDWLMERKDFSSHLRFYPTWIVEDLAEKFFWQHAQKFLLMSATFHPVPILAKLLGLKSGDISFKEMSSLFPVENRRVVISPVANLTFKTFDEEAPKLIDKIEEILRKHDQDKGIIHCTSFKLAKFLMENINTSRLITHDSKNRSEILEKFKRSKEPLVLVSPSYERGISLDDELSRFCVYAKAPFLSLADKQVSKRLYGSKLGKIWYGSDCSQSIVQGSGRIVRNESDFGIVYILDRQIVNLLTSHPSYFPEHYRDSLEFDY